MHSIAQHIQYKVMEAGASGIVVGMSGGIDSSVVAALCSQATDTLGLIMPCHSNPQDAEHAKEIAELFSIRTKTIDLSKAYDTMLAILPQASKVTKANLKARLRAATLYYFANSENRLVAGTGNKSELFVGYFTKYGDGAADILPIGNLLKSEVRELAFELGIPAHIHSKTPSAGLWEGQTDEDELGLTYEEIDNAIRAAEGNSQCDADTLKKVKALHERSKHKRRVPETL
ncbi:MAG: NAD+ synthase [Candidatus Diapherotrites archaeon]|nr:NAD+ synthase [Candidatus Diapherotrites archaeon]